MNSLYPVVSEKVDWLREHSPFTTTFLKMVAVISMLVDHTAATVIRALRSSPILANFPWLSAHITQVYKLMRRFGRLAFPIYCFFIVEGYFRTHDVKKYILRLSILAVLSEFPFDYALHHGQALMTKQNVYFTLLIGLLVIWAINDWFRGMTAVQLIIMIFGIILAKFLRTDYQYHGVFLIEMLYVTRFSRAIQSLCGGTYISWYEGSHTAFSFVLTFFYNNKRGRPMKLFFYWFYPIHLLVLGFIAYVLMPMLR